MIGISILEYFLFVCCRNWKWFCYQLVICWYLRLSLSLLIILLRLFNYFYIVILKSKSRYVLSVRFDVSKNCWLWNFLFVVWLGNRRRRKLIRSSKKDKLIFLTKVSFEGELATILIHFFFYFLNSLRPILKYLRALRKPRLICRFWTILLFATIS